jgi:hypothetical protein
MRSSIGFRALILTVSFVFLAFSGAQAQEETLLTGGIRSGGFGGPVVKFSQVNDSFGLFVGGRGGWIINSTFVIGGGGYGLANDVVPDDSSSPFDPFRRIDMGYGGLELEYIGLSNRLIHYSVYVLIGGGGVSYLDPISDSFFVLEPAVNVEVNLVSWFRLNGGVGYRYVTGVDGPELTNSDLSAFAGSLTFKFGKF